MIAVSMDDAETQKKFKATLKAPFSFVADPDGKLVKMFDVKMAVVSYAQRITFVIGEGQKILQVQSGNDAIDPSAAITSCPLRKHGAPDVGAK